MKYVWAAVCALTLSACGPNDEPSLAETAIAAPVGMATTILGGLLIVAADIVTLPIEIISPETAASLKAPLYQGAGFVGDTGIALLDGTIRLIPTEQFRALAQQPDIERVTVTFERPERLRPASTVCLVEPATQTTFCDEVGFREAACRYPLQSSIIDC